MRFAAPLAFCALALSACDRGAPESEAPSAARAAPAPDAFCIEHGVAEAVCTKCNPKLVLIFQEKGDWCAEHGFPESFCPRCHPELGGRPAVALGSDAPPTGTKVVFATPEVARLAGIETALAEEHASAEHLDVLGTVAYDAARHAQVNARVRGILREILVDVGSRVAQGAALVRIESAEVGAEQARLLAAGSRIAVAEAAHERIQALFEKGMAAQKDLLAAQLELDTARAEKAAAEAALGIVGVDGTSGNLYTLTAPIAGTCVRRATAFGRMVEAGETLCEIVDTSVMWAELDVPETELARVRNGLEVEVSADSLGERRFHGQIDSVAPAIDRHTRTATVRVRLENPDGSLRANLFVRARIALAAKQARVLVPRESVQLVKGVELAFVELAPGRYEVRRVRTDAALGDLIELLQGVEPGERVVTKGSYLLRTETLKGEIGAGCCAEE